MSKKINEVASNSANYGADAGEPDTGWLPGGDVRTLGFESGKPEPWFHQGQYEQVDFPVASFIYGSKKEDNALAYTVKKQAKVVDMESVIKDLDLEIQELMANTEQMYKDIKRG
jgi:hypothetical protein